jgi:hypothetical protein
MRTKITPSQNPSQPHHKDRAAAPEYTTKNGQEEKLNTYITIT